jgi:hypothetical protein
MFYNPEKDSFCGLGRERRCVMRLAILSLAFAGFLAFGANFAVAADVAANLSAIPYVTSSADANSAVVPVQWYTYRYPSGYGYYSYPYYSYTYPNYGYYTYRPTYVYPYSTPSYGYYTYPYSGYYVPNGVYYRAARPYIYRY